MQQGENKLIGCPIHDCDKFGWMPTSVDEPSVTVCLNKFPTGEPVTIIVDAYTKFCNVSWSPDATIVPRYGIPCRTVGVTVKTMNDRTRITNFNHDPDAEIVVCGGADEILKEIGR